MKAFLLQRFVVNLKDVADLAKPESFNLETYFSVLKEMEIVTMNALYHVHKLEDSAQNFCNYEKLFEKGSMRTKKDAVRNIIKKLTTDGTMLASTVFMDRTLKQKNRFELIERQLLLRDIIQSHKNDQGIEIISLEEDEEVKVENASLEINNSTNPIQQIVAID